MAFSAFPQEPLHTDISQMKKLVAVREQSLDDFLELTANSDDEYFLLIIKAKCCQQNSLDLCLHARNCVVFAIVSEDTFQSATAYAKLSYTFLESGSCKLPLYYFGLGSEGLLPFIFRKKFKKNEILNQMYLPVMTRCKIVILGWLLKSRNLAVYIFNKFV